MTTWVPPPRGSPLCCLAAILVLYAAPVLARRPEPYYGRMIGRLTQYAHGIRGTVYAVDESTVFVRGFAYDGTGPDAYFWVGDTPQPSPEGTLVPYPEDYTTRDPPILTAHSNSDILLRLPGGKRLRDIKWISVWCRRFTVNFGDVFIPPGLDPPRPRVLPEFKRLAHGLRSGNISVLDAKTFYIPNLHYDGAGPDAYFWVGNGSEPSPFGTKFKRLAHGLRSGNISVLDAKTFYIPNLHYDGAGPDAYFWVGNGSEPSPFGTKVPNEMGSLHPLRGYQGEDIEIQLPGKLTAYDIDWLAVWCVEYRHNFGHVYIPKDLDVPPALGQTKITPAWWYNPTSSTTSQTPYSATNNCKEILDKRLQVRWEIQGEQVQITLAARLRKDQYMAFGVSGAEGRPAMLGADVVVAFWDTKSNQPKAVDYSISHLAQCDGVKGVCPDARIGGSNDAVLVSGNQKNGVTTITYRRPLAAKESGQDREVLTSRAQSVIAAFGPLNSRQEANAHSFMDTTRTDVQIDFGAMVLTSRAQSVIAAFGPLNSRQEANAHSFMDTTRTDVQIDFGAMNDNTCIGLAELEPEGPPAWEPRVIAGVTNFTARIGPAGGVRGYTPITGHPSWGIAWYINDQLIPQLYVERGKTYTFYVEGGDDRTNPAKFHPLYISDSAEGGFGQKREDERRRQRVFAGVAYDAEGYPYPTAVGRYCEWTHKTIDQSATSETFEDYMQTLQLECNEGEPAVLNWTVAHETPDLVYYQCYTHNNLGWKIHVVDPGTKVPFPSDQRARINKAAPILAPTSRLTGIAAVMILSVMNMVTR